MLFRRIGICRHGMKRHFGNRKRGGFVEVHVLHESVRVEEVIARPSGSNRRQGGSTEFSVDVVAGSEDHKAIVNLRQQRSHVSVASVTSAKLRKRSRRTGLIVVVGEIA